MENGGRNLFEGELNSAPVRSYGDLASVWAMIRLPLLLLILVVFRRPIEALVLDIFGLDRVTLFVINVLSTPASRAVYFMATVLVLLTCTVISRSYGLTKAYVMISAVGTVLFIGACLLTSRSLVFAAPAVIMLLSNLAPGNLTSKFAPRSTRLFLTAAVAISEVFFFWRHIRWILWERTGHASLKAWPRWRWALPGIVLASATSAALLNGSRLVPLEQALRSSSQVRIVAAGEDYNWMQLDPSGKQLFVAGHGLNRIRRYNLVDELSSFVDSEVVTNHAQDFAYDPSANELYVYDEPNGKLLYVDGQNLTLKRSTDLKGVSPGDSWLAFDPNTQTILVSSEADEQVGTPFHLVDRASGQVLSTLNEDAGSLLVDTKKSIAYLNYFRRKAGLLAYDIKRHEVIRKAGLTSNADRMAVWQRENELLVTLPVESRIARFDADTLQPKGNFSTVFGVRTLAIDEASNVLLSGSLATGMLEVIDLSRETRLASFYLGPWLRTIQVLPDRGLAYVSSNGAIYQVRYK